MPDPPEMPQESVSTSPSKGDAGWYKRANSTMVSGVSKFRSDHAIIWTILWWAVWCVGIIGPSGIADIPRGGFFVIALRYLGLLAIGILFCRHYLNAKKLGHPVSWASWALACFLSAVLTYRLFQADVTHPLLPPQKLNSEQSPAIAKSVVPTPVVQNSTTSPIGLNPGDIYYMEKQTEFQVLSQFLNLQSPIETNSSYGSNSPITNVSSSGGQAIGTMNGGMALNNSTVGNLTYVNPEPTTPQKFLKWLDDVLPGASDATIKARGEGKGIIIGPISITTSQLDNLQNIITEDKTKKLSVDVDDSLGFGSVGQSKSIVPLKTVKITAPIEFLNQ